MIDRMDKIDKLIKQEVSKAFPEFFEDIIISVTAVEVTRDLEIANIWVSVIGDHQKTVRLLNKKAKAIRAMISKRIVLKKIPYLRFRSDTTSTEGDRIDHLIDQAMKENE